MVFCKPTNYNYLKVIRCFGPRMILISFEQIHWSMFKLPIPLIIIHECIQSTQYYLYIIIYYVQYFRYVFSERP